MGKNRWECFTMKMGKKSRWECLTMKMERKQVEMFYNENGKKNRWECLLWKWTFRAGPGVLRGRAWHRCEKLLFLGGIQVNTYSHSTQIPLKPIFLYRHHFRLVPTPACNMGYCVGEGVPCPKGLASTNGYTPCDCESLLCQHHHHHLYMLS